MTAEDEFNEYFLFVLNEAEAITGHPFTKLRALIIEKTAVGAARLLLSPAGSAGFSYGFEVLAGASLLSHSIEAAALKFADSGLFTDEQLSKARAQLAIARLIWSGAGSRFRN